MLIFCSVANCLNSSRNRPDLSFFCFPSEQSSRRLRKNFCPRRSDPELRDKEKTRICSAHFEASSIKSSLGGEERLSQVNYRSILIPRQTKVLFLPVKRHWMIGRNEHFMNNILNLKRVEGLPRKVKIPVSQAKRQFF